METRREEKSRLRGLGNDRAARRCVIEDADSLTGWDCTKKVSSPRLCMSGSLTHLYKKTMRICCLAGQGPPLQRFAVMLHHTIWQAHIDA
jgi:hypothetical protein